MIFKPYYYFETGCAAYLFGCGSLGRCAIGIGLVVLATGFEGFAAGGVFLGIGTAMMYPTLLAAIGDVAHPSWRASSVGVYRLWRDLGYAIGALVAGVTADALGLPSAMWLVAALTLGSGVIVAVRMKETLKPHSDAAPPPTCVRPSELRERIAHRDGPTVVDFREPDEFEAAHVEGALNIPLEALEQRAAELPKDGLIVTVCGKGGGRSDRAAALLRSIGFASARSLCGGTQSWLEHVEKGA